MVKKTELTKTELRRKYSKWMINFVKGIQEIQNLDRNTQTHLWFCMLNECLYTTESNPFLSKMYKFDGLYEVEDSGLLEDFQLMPMNRARLVEGMKSYLMNGGKRKWTDTLKRIEDSFDRGDY